MARPRVDDNPVYVEVKARFEPLKNKVANARIMADAMVENAKREVEQEMLALVKYGIENGLSRNAIGRITGKTSNADQIALVERAMGSGFAMPLSMVQQAVEPEPDATPDMPAPDGWEFSDVAGDPGGPGASVTLSSPDGELFRMTVDDSDVRQYYDESDGHRLDAQESLERIPDDVDVYVKWLVYGPLDDM